MNLLVAVDTSASALAMSSPHSQNSGRFFYGPLNWRNTAAVASGLRTIFMNVEQQYAHKYFIFATPATATCSWRSTPTTVIQLATSFDTECQLESYRTRSNYSSREQKWRRTQLKSVVPFRVEIDVGAKLDPMLSNTTNALLREHFVAGVAFLPLLSKQRIDVNDDIKRFSDVYEECARSRARDILGFRGASLVPRASPFRVAAAFC